MSSKYRVDQATALQMFGFKAALLEHAKDIILDILAFRMIGRLE